MTARQRSRSGRICPAQSTVHRTPLHMEPAPRSSKQQTELRAVILSASEAQSHTPVSVTEGMTSWATAPGRWATHARAASAAYAALIAGALLDRPTSFASPILQL